jgi:hypothetical protein
MTTTVSEPHDARDLKASIRELATALEESLPGHLGPEELQDFAAGTLPEPERERIREHLALCRTCARKALDLMESPQLTDRELEAQWQRFRTAMPARARWKRAVLALAAVLLLGIAGVVWNTQSRLFEVELTAMRGATAEQVQLPARTGRVRFNLTVDGQSPAYDVEIVASDGRQILSERGVPQRDGLVVVEVPARRLPQGAYRIRVSGPQGLEAEYRIQVEPASD